MTATTPLLKKTTKLQDKRAARDRCIYNEYKRLSAVEGQSKTEIVKYLMAKYEICSNGTIYTIIKRVESKLQKGDQA